VGDRPSGRVRVNNRAPAGQERRIDRDGVFRAFGAGARIPIRASVSVTERPWACGVPALSDVEHRALASVRQSFGDEGDGGEWATCVRNPTAAGPRVVQRGRIGSRMEAGQGSVDEGAPEQRERPVLRVLQDIVPLSITLQDVGSES
jgi:hypothetical protein